MRILIVSNDRGTADAIRCALQGVSTGEVVGSVHGRRQWWGLARAWRPDLVLIREPAALARRRRIAEAQRAAPSAKIVLVADSADPDELADLVTAGVDAAVSACAGPAAVGVLIDAIAAGHVYSPVRQPVPRVDRHAASVQGLTGRELEILKLTGSGLANGQIAAQLGVSAPTVKFHLSNVYRKLGLANRTAAALYAHRCHLLDTHPAPDSRHRAA